MINCPVCKSAANFFVSKSDKFGQQYEYFKCAKCRFLFDKDLAINPENLQKKISKAYQKDYDKIDFGWRQRGDSVSKKINKLLKICGILRFGKKLSVLDYGAGSGYITSKIDNRFSVFYYDKYAMPEYKNTNYRILKTPQETDVVLAVEVLEHIANPKNWTEIFQLAGKAAFFITELSDGIGDKELSNWWYLKPEVGHTCVYSSASLRILAKKHGFAYLFFPSKSLHLFFRSSFFKNFNFVILEYPFYNLFRRIKHILKR